MLIATKLLRKLQETTTGTCKDIVITHKPFVIPLIILLSVAKALALMDLEK